MARSEAQANKLLNNIFKGAAVTHLQGGTGSPNVYIALGNGAVTVATGAFTEVVANHGATRPGMDVSTPAGGSCNNLGVISWTASGGSFTFDRVMVMTTAGFNDGDDGTKVLAWGNVASTTVNDGVTAQFSTGNLTISEG